jgi:hypothetical protein
MKFTKCDRCDQECDATGRHVAIEVRLPTARTEFSLERAQPLDLCGSCWGALDRFLPHPLKPFFGRAGIL